MTVPVERDGEYQVSIFAFREGIGILRSGVDYIANTQQLVMVHTLFMEESSTASQPDHISTVQMQAAIIANIN